MLDSTLNFAVQLYDGNRSRADQQADYHEAMDEAVQDFTEMFGWDPKPLFESFGRPSSRFSFAALERSILQMESAEGRPRPNRYNIAETITSSQTGAAIGLVVMHQIMDSYTQQPAIFRELAEVENSTGDSELYPEEFMDDMPVMTAETEPATETRAGSSVVRIKNYQYARALAISKHHFDNDKTGFARRISTTFGKKFPIAQDRAWVNAVFRTFVPANLETNGGIIPGTNIAGYGPGNGFGTGASYAGVLGIPAGYNPQPSALTPTAIENALLASATFVDPYGVEIGSGEEFNTLLCDSLDRFKAKRFLTSNVNPVQLGTPDGTGQQPGAFTDNIIKGEFTVAHSPYVKKTRAPLSGQGLPWMTFKAKDNGLVMQILQEYKVEQELSLAGKSFDEASYRWRADGWFGAGVRSGRKAFVGN